MPAYRTRDMPSPFEGMLDALESPTLQCRPDICSPTPRAFTFPLTYDCFDSPSGSPFELEPLGRDPTELKWSSATHPLLPSMFTSAPTLPVPTLQTAEITKQQRRHRTPAEKADFIQRPPNAFILFRSQFVEEHNHQVMEEKHEAAECADALSKKQNQADLSKTISQQWKTLSEDERKVWQERAEEKKLEHQKLYPDYSYSPRRSVFHMRHRPLSKDSSRFVDKDIGRRRYDSVHQEDPVSNKNMNVDMFSKASNVSMSETEIVNAGGNVTINHNHYYLPQSFSDYLPDWPSFSSLAETAKKVLPGRFWSSPETNLEETTAEDAPNYPPWCNAQIIQKKISMSMPGFAPKILLSIRYSFF